jgi:hypothetical protein
MESSGAVSAGEESQSFVDKESPIYFQRMIREHHGQTL